MLGTGKLSILMDLMMLLVNNCEMFVNQTMEAFT